MLLITTSFLFAQEKTIKGSVVDGTGVPVPGVSVIIKGTSKGVATDFDGNYEITTNDSNAVLVYNFLGFLPKEEAVNGRGVINVTLKEDVAQLDEVVVVGYGTQKKENLTGAVGVLDSEEIGNQSVTSAGNALQGRVSGVHIVQPSGQPGADNPTIQIRGVGTVRSSVSGQNDDSAPLVLIDGVQSTLNDVNPNDIESFSVLKDAASAAIYGARAANGVILVTTKRGKNGVPKISFNSSVAFQSATATPNMLSSYDYAVLKNEAQTNVGREELFSAEELELFRNGTSEFYPDVDYFDQGYRKGAPLINHYLSATGGSDNVKYMISVGYQDQEGIVINTDSQRYNFRSNVDVDVSDKFRIGLNIAGSYLESDEPNYGGLGVNQFIRDMIRQAPLAPERYSNGYISAGNYILGSRTNSSINPIGLATEGGEDKEKYYRATPNVYVEFEPVKDLIFKLDGSVYYNNRKRTKFRNKMTVSDGDRVFTSNGLGELFDSDLTSTTSTLEFTGRYFKNFGKSNFNILGGLTKQTYREDFFSSSNQGYSTDFLTELDAGSLNPSVSGNATEWALSSAFGRASYDYDGKYLAEFNLRYDGSSRFGENERFGYFPSFSVGWNIAKENFLKESRAFNELKLRASWGQLGNQNIGNYASIATVNLSQPYVFGNSLVSGAAIRSLSNPNVKWETTTTTDVGLDMSMFGNRVSLVADYYIRTSDDILLSPPIVATLGNLSAPVQNQGSVENRGYELVVGYNDQIGEDFSFGISANWSHNDNEVLKLDSEFISSNKVITREGLPINSFYGHRIIGIFQTDEEAQDSDTYGVQPGGPSVGAGDYIYEDTNGDGTVDSDDRVVIGNPNIQNTYGFTLNMNYKGFDFRTLFQGVYGRDVENGVYGTDGLRGNSNITEAYLDRWTPENTDTDLPRVATGYKYNTSLFVGPTISSAIVDASYLRMKHIEFGYTIPIEYSSKFGFSKVRFYVAGQNLLTITDFVDGFDPEDAATFNNTNDSYPQAKTYALGVNLIF